MTCLIFLTPSLAHSRRCDAISFEASASTLATSRVSNPQKTERPQQWRAPRPLVISSFVLVIGIALSFVGALFSVTATHSTQQERLRLQLSGVSSEVSSTLNSIQVPLESAERVAQSVNQLSFFRTVASSQVGTDSPFRSLVLFDMSTSRNSVRKVATYS